LKNRILIFILTIFFVEHIQASEETIETKIDAMATQIVSNMTLKEKIGQVIHIAIPGKSVTKEIVKEIKKIRPGGIIHFGTNLDTQKQIKELNLKLQLSQKALKGVPLYISTDQEGGKVIRVKDGVTQFPGAMAIGQTSNVTYANRVGFITSYQLNQLGINLLFAPSLDINNNPLNPVIHVRSFGSDLETVTKMGLAYEEGARFGGALPVIKHFPGHGDTNIDSHKGLPIIHKSLETLKRLELIPFEKALQNGAKAVMSAHILYPELDKEFPATLSPVILDKLLRGTLNHKGLIFTDAMEMDAISKNYSKHNVAALALKAGADILLLTSWGKNPEDYQKMLLKAYKNKELHVNGVNILDVAVKRQIISKIEQGLFSEKYSYHQVKDQEIVDRINEKKEKAKQRYVELTKNDIDKLNDEISISAIRSYKKNFFPLKENEIKNTTFFIRSKYVANILQEKGIEVVQYKKLVSHLKKNKPLKVLLETEKEKNVLAVNKIIESFPDIDFTIIHYGSPYLKFPDRKGIQVIFSFSPTHASKKAVFDSLFFAQNAKPIKPASLIFE
jgi:beta-N-acetylhexosaminidase